MIDIRPLLDLKTGESVTFQATLLNRDYEGPQVAITVLDPLEQISFEQYYKITKIEISPLPAEELLCSHITI